MNKGKDESSSDSARRVRNISLTSHGNNLIRQRIQQALHKLEKENDNMNIERTQL
jgi:seryl-tRNA(Sec) selenium transferase